jgi:DegV family protein with EDD domain
MKIKICADSTCDLSPELVEKYDIGILPLYIVKDGVSLADGVEICPQDIFDHVRGGGAMCSTAAVSVADYEAFFTEQRKNCDAMIHFHISSEMSSCYQNACIAAESVPGVYPVDSRNLSTGIGQLVLLAAEMAAEGSMSAEEIYNAILDKREKLDVSFVLDTLEYLRKGGRCSTLAAMGANLLSLKPCIEVRDGVMGVGKKYRGKLGSCVVQYVHDRLAGRDDIDLKRIFITDSTGFTQEELDAVEAEVRRCQPFEEILHTHAGCTISSHCGPRCIGILYFHK